MCIQLSKLLVNIIPIVTVVPKHVQFSAYLHFKSQVFQAELANFTHTTNWRIKNSFPKLCLLNVTILQQPIYICPLVQTHNLTANYFTRFSLLKRKNKEIVDTSISSFCVFAIYSLFVVSIHTFHRQSYNENIASPISFFIIL